MCCCIYLEYVGYNCVVMFILLLVELLQVGGIVALTVSSHLVSHLSLLSCLKKTKHTNMHITDMLSSINPSVPD